MRWASSLWKLPVLSGLLLAGAYIAFPPILLNFIAFVPVLYWLEINDDRPAKERRRGAFLFGATAYSISLHWMYSMLEYSWLAVILYVGLAAIFAVYAMWALRLAAWVRRRTGWSWAVALPICWIPLEWSRDWTDVRMTADFLGQSFGAYPFLVQFADLVGPYGVGAFMLVVNALLFEAIRARKTPDGRRKATVLAGLMLGVLAYDTWAWTHPPTEVGHIRVGWVQPNIPLDFKHALGTEADQSATLTRMTKEAVQGGAEIVAWPESSWPWPIVHRLDTPATYSLPEVQVLARETRTTILTGVLYSRYPRSGEPSTYNAAVAVHPDGSLDPVWSAKIILVPFVEGLPFKLLLGPALAGREWLGGGFTPGPGVSLIPVAGYRVGTMVCYEELYFDLARELRNAGAGFQVILTNDAWFGRSFFQRYQADTVRLRAIENRCAFVRVANTGISGLVDPLGRYHGRTELDTAAVGVRDVPVTEGRTIYGRIGNVVAWIAIGGLGAGIVRSVRRSKKPPSESRDGGSHDVGDDRPDVGSLPGAGPVES